MQEQDAVTLQLATLRDVRGIANMSAALIEQGLPHSWTERRVLAHIRHRECTVLVAKLANQLTGFAIMEFGNTMAHLNLLAVDPRWQRRGIGRQLLEWLHESALTIGTFVVKLELRAENGKARRFYASLGYDECGYVPRYYCNVEDAVLMSRDLTVR
ncbi:MAG TPA: GNAT family N-acetyltransferase [Steroidobacteraceae bacterium]|nr:GNAT family N-acetyltransferase [Steroidobacteraceae bacterium]